MSDTDIPAGLERRREDYALITGYAHYVDDLRPPQGRPAALHMAVVRSPYAHAEIQHIQLNDARALPGVVATFAADELVHTLPNIETMPVPRDLKRPVRKPLALRHARYMGDPVAVVVAEDAYTAQDALDLVDIDYAQVTSKPPTLQDPLTSSGTNKWEVDQTPQRDGCLFINGSYHAIMPKANQLEYCEESAQQCHNFAYQATMTILKGNVGGIIFNGAGVGKPQFYYFEINSADSSYFFARHMEATYNQIKTLRASSSAAIHANLNVPNTLTVIAQDGTFYLYINGQFVDMVEDSTFKSGNIGVVADNFGNPTDIVFRDVKVWKLS